MNVSYKALIGAVITFSGSAFGMVYYKPVKKVMRRPVLMVAANRVYAKLLKKRKAVHFAPVVRPVMHLVPVARPQFKVRRFAPVPAVAYHVPRPVVVGALRPVLVNRAYRAHIMRAVHVGAFSPRNGFGFNVGFGF